MSRSRSEGVRNTLHLPFALGDDVELCLAARELGVSGEPRFGSSGDPPHLLPRHHLERVAPIRPALRLHLAEHDRPAATDDEVELVAPRPRIGCQDPVAAQPVMPQGTPFRARPDGAGGLLRPL
jgi:hypothetical protein